MITYKESQRERAQKPRSPIPELVRRADHVTTTTNDKEGAAEFFEMLLSAKKG